MLRPSLPRIRSRLLPLFRARTAALLAPLGLLPAALAFAAPALAATFVSNTGQPDHQTDVKGFSKTTAQSFRTGGSSAGYTLTHVDLRMFATRSDTDIEVSIRSDSSGSPDSTLGTLTDPASYSTSMAQNRFAASGDGIDLAANTRYWVVSTPTTLEGLQEHGGFDQKESDDEDAGAFPGWSIGDGQLTRTAGRWTIGTHALGIAIIGDAKDTTAPTLSRAKVDGSTLTLSYDESLDPDSTPATTDITVSVAGTDQNPSSVAVSGNVVTLTLGTAATAGQTVTVTYTKGTNPIRNFAALDAVGLSSRSVTNVTGETKPTVSAVAIVSTPYFDVDSNDTPETYGLGEEIQVQLTFSAAVTVAGTPRLKIRMASTSEQWADYDSGSGGTKLTFVRTVEEPDQSTQGIAVLENTLELNFGAIESATSADATLTHAGLGHDAGHKVDWRKTDTTAPAVRSAAVNKATLTVAFDETLDSGSQPAGSRFSVNATPQGGPSRTIAGTGTASISDDKVTVTLNEAVAHGETLTMAYTKGTETNPLQDTYFAPNEVADFAGRTATNRTPPVFSSAVVDGTQLTVTFDVNLASGTRPAGSTFSVQATATDNTVRTIAGTGTVSIRLATVTVTLASAVAGTETVSVGYTRPDSGSKLQDPNGNEVETFSGEAVTNDSGPPTFSSATVDGNRLTVTFDEDLEETSVPVASAFTVAVGTGTGTIDSVAVSGETVILTLDSLVANTDTVKVAYTKPTTGDTLKDPGNNEVATFADQAVTNATAPPTVQSASVNGEFLSLTFSESIVDPSSGRWVTAFSVSAGGDEYVGGSLTGLGDATAQIRFAVPVPPGETVTLSYTKPDSNPLTDLGGNALATFTGGAVTNNTPADAAPAVYSAEVNGATLAAKFNASLKTTSVPAASTFTVRVGSTTRNVTNVAIDGRTLTLTLASAVTVDDTGILLAYAKPSTGNKLQGANDAEVNGFNKSVTNNTTDTTPPAFQSASVSGDALTVTFDEALDTGSAPVGSAFTVTATESGTERTINGTAAAVGIDGATVTATLASAVTAADAVEVAYTQPTTGDKLKDADDNEVATFTDQVVTNATAPVFSSAAVNGATLTVTFNANLDDTRFAPHATAFPVTVGSAARSVDGVSLSGKTVTLTLDSAVTAVDTTVKVRYTKPPHNSLQGGNGTEVATFADQAVSNATPPAFSDATVDGATLTVTFDVDLDTGSVPAPSAFTVTVGSDGRTVDSVSLSGKAVTLTLDSAVKVAEVVQVRYTQPESNPLEGSANDAEVATFANQAVSNATLPAVSSATVDGATLTLVFDEALDVQSVPAPGDFYVTVGSDRRDVATNGVSIDGTTVTLTLDSAVAEGDTVKVRYTKPSSGELQADVDLDADVATFADQAVTNVTDTTAPTFQSASVDGDTLTATFDEALDEASVPAPGAFTVTVSGAGRTVDSVAIDDDTVTLTLDSAVTLSDTILVRYDKPDDDPLRDPSGNPVATFADQAVSNATLPEFESAAVNKSALTLVFDETLDEASVPAPGAFTVTVSGAARTVDSVAIDDDTVTLTLASAVTDADTVVVRYDKPTSNPLQDLADHEVATFGDQAVVNDTDSTVPGIQADSVAVNGTRLTFNFDEALAETSVPAPGAFAVTVSGIARTVDSVAIDEDTVTLTLASAVTNTDTVQVTYTEDADNPLQDLASNVVGDFGPMDVTNHTADVVAPAFQGAEVDGAALALTFGEALDAGSVPAPSAFVVTVEGTRRAVVANGVAIAEETKVALTLSSAVSAAEAVTVRYARPSSDPLADGAGNRVASFANHRVANLTADTTAPAFRSATINGVALTLTFDEALDADSVPGPDGFTVTVGGAPRDLADDQKTSGGDRTVKLVGATATVRLASPVTDTAVVAVRYVQPASNPLQDAAGNAVASFAEHSVTNDTSALPVFLGATVNGESMEILFNRNISFGNGTGIRVYVNGTARKTGTYAIGDEYVKLGLTPSVTHGDTVTVSYTKATSSVPLADIDGNEVASFSNKKVTNLTPDETAPVLRGAVAGGTTLTLTFDESLDANALAPAASAFTVAGTETPTQVVAVAFHPSIETRVGLTLSQAVTASPTVTVSYTKPAGNPLRDPAGNEVADFANEPLRAPPAPPPPPPPPPTPHTVPNFLGGDTAQLFVAPDHADGAPVGTVVAIDADGDVLIYSLAGADSALFTIDDTGLIAVAPGTALAGEGRDLFTVTAQVSDGENAVGSVESTPVIDDTIEVTITLADIKEHRVPLVPSASDPLHRQGFVRVINHSAQAGEVSILAVDDAGLEHGPAVLDIDARHTVHFNSRDLEQGNARKGLEEGTGPGEGNWRLVLTSALDLEVLSYIRTDDGFVTSMHDLVPADEAGEYRVVFFNPGSNRNQVSRLRLINPGETPVDITITGTDDAGEAGESAVELTLGAGAARALAAQALESGQGEGLVGALGDGTGKWRLRVTADRPLRVMSLLSTPTGHMTNLSATPGRQASGTAAVSHRVPLAPSASDPLHRQGFVRVINHSAQAGEVSITAIDDAGMRYGPVVFDIGAHRTVHFNSDDLEQGNAGKGLQSGTGPGEGDWRLVIESALDLEVLSYIRTDDGFVTSMHEVAPEDEAGHRVVFVNPASNRNQRSRLRLINPGEVPVDLTITGTDDAGKAGEGPVALTLAAGASRYLSSQALESGEGEGLAGALGDGKGKWRLRVTADGPIRVMSLLSSGPHLTNVSTATARKGVVHRVPLLPAAAHPHRDGVALIPNSE